MTTEKRILQRACRTATILVVALALAACSQPRPASPTPAAATTVSASSPTADVGTPVPAADAGGTATAQASANGTVIASAVEGTVTVVVQALATTAALNSQQTATAVAPTSGPVSSPTTSALTPTSPATVASPTGAIASTCPAQPVRGFGLLYTTNSTVATRLGCAVQGEVGTTSAVQSFEGGVMLEFGNSKQVLVLRNSGATWSAVDDTYQTGQPLPTPTAVPPAGRFVPANSFGQVWLKQPDVGTQLGWATGPEQKFTTGATELFAHGRIVWTPNKIHYVLYSDNTWQSFPDTFQG